MGECPLLDTESTLYCVRARDVLCKLGKYSELFGILERCSSVIMVQNLVLERHLETVVEGRSGCYYNMDNQEKSAVLSRKTGGKWFT